MNNHRESDSALGRYRVLDLTDGGCMLGGRMLGDLGADVIKIEPPQGSLSRIGPFYKDITEPEKSLFWFAYNTNKRGITLDITQSEGQKVFKELVKTVDIVMESYEPGYMSSLKLGYSYLCEIKPDIIFTSISPFGQSGPKAHYKESELTSWASGGYLYLCGNPDRAPTWIGFPQAFLHGGAEAAVGTMTALWHRQGTGEGQQVDVSIQECIMSSDMNALHMWDVNGVDFCRYSGWQLVPSTGVRLQNGYRCKDGDVILHIMGGSETSSASMRRLVAWMEEEGMADDWLKQIDWMIEYNASILTQDMVDKVESAVAKFALTKTKAELYEEGAIKRRIILAPVCNTRDICENPQLRFRNYWVKVLHPESGEALTYCGPFARLSETPIVYRRRAPLIGEHNEDVYVKELGLSAENLTSLKQAGVI
ncbi:CaiB/BaiF CoA transferase family protein [Chloroflexota bacterium]